MPTKNTEKKSSTRTRRRTSRKQEEEELDELTEGRSGRGIGMVLVVIIALIIGIIIGILAGQQLNEASEVIEPQQEVDQVQLEQIEEERRAQEEQKRVEEEARLEAEALAEAQREREGNVVADPDNPDTQTLYTNDYYGFQLAFPKEWEVIHEEIERVDRKEGTVLYIRTFETPEVIRSGFIPVGGLQIRVSVLEGQFEDFVREGTQTAEKLLAYLESDSVMTPDPPTLEDVVFGSETLVIDGHNAAVNWEIWSKSDFADEPPYTWREYWIERDGPTVFHVELLTPTAPDGSLTLREGRNVMATWQFLNKEENE